MLVEKSKNMSKVGIMQGRLTEKNGFFPQVFPQNEWETEFRSAKDIGIECIEWMFNADEWTKNPLVTEEGIIQIQNQIKSTGVSVSGICANYYMKNSIFTDGKNMLHRIVKCARIIGCHNVIIPLFEASDIENCEEGFQILEEVIRSISDVGVQILLETDAELDKVVDFCQKFTADNVGICYDIGNATGLGKDVVHEIEKGSKYIKNVHLKDKKRGGTSVMLGQGDALFEECFYQLEKNRYQGSFILESYFEKAVEDTLKNYLYVKDKMKI